VRCGCFVRPGFTLPTTLRNRESNLASRYVPAVPCLGVCLVWFNVVVCVVFVLRCGSRIAASRLAPSAMAHPGIAQYGYSQIIVRDEAHAEFPPPNDPTCEWIPTIEAGARLPFCPVSVDCADVENAHSLDIFSALSCDSLTLLLVGIEARATQVPTGSDTVAQLVPQLQESFFSQRIPLRVARVRIHQTGPPSAHTQIAALFCGVDMLVVRPDHTISWVFRSKNHRNMDGRAVAVLADSVVRTISGHANTETDAAEKEGSYLRWLRAEFLNNIKPYRFKFKMAMRLNDQTKPEAIAAAKAKGHSVETTTKQAGTGGAPRAATAPDANPTDAQHETDDAEPRQEPDERAAPGEGSPGSRSADDWTKASLPSHADVTNRRRQNSEVDSQAPLAQEQTPLQVTQL
jgi:hypothetical protein